jgi:NTP pyrophosphatase (non-canonical NTP hydrolase)
MRELLLGEVDEYFAETDPDAKAKELSDCLWFLITMAILTGVDLEKEIREKAAYNMIRYQAKYFQDGDYYEARRRVKAEEKNLGLKDEFYSI